MLNFETPVYFNGRFGKISGRTPGNNTYDITYDLCGTIKCDIPRVDFVTRLEYNQIQSQLRG